MVNADLGHIILSFLFYNIILIIFYRHYKRGDYYIGKWNLVLYTIILIAFGVYGGGEGDYLHYKDKMSLYHSLADVYYYDMMEIQYNYLAYLVNGNYDLWRLVVFSVQFIGLSWFLYKAKLNTYPVLLSFITICLVISIYGRAFWGLIYYFLGVFLLIKKKNPLFLVFIALCYVSHTQNIVLLVLLPLAFIDLKRWHLLIVFLAFSVLVSLFQDSFSAFLDSNGIEGADHLNTKLQIYGQKGSHGAFGQSIGEVTMFILRYVPAVSILLYLLYILIKYRSRYLRLYIPYRRIISVTTGLLLISLIVLSAEMSSGTLFYRILAMIFFPVSLLLPYLKESKMIKKETFDILIKLYIITAELGYIKDFYYTYVGGV